MTIKELSFKISLSAIVKLYKAYRWLRRKFLGLPEPPKRKFGWIHQHVDPRDKQLRLKVRKLPIEVDLRKGCPTIFDQSSLGSCTANAIAAAYEFTHMKEGLPNFIPSRLFIYYNEREIEGTIKDDAGAMIRDGFKTIGTGDKAKGVCSESKWPYVIDRFAVKPCSDSFKEALNNHAIEYFSVNQSPSQLKGCLADGYPFVFGFTVTENFMEIGSDGIMKMPEGAVEGGHAVMCVGYSDINRNYIVQNSWGAEWGDKGYFYMPYDYMHNVGLCDDFWSIRRVS